MAQYRRLSLMEREELSRMLAAGSSLRTTAQAMNRAPSTLSRELTRQHASPVTYRAVPAHQRAQRRAHQPRNPRKLAVQPRLRTAVFRLLAQRWSPEQIAHGLPQRYPDEPTMRISHEAIYTYLYVLPRGTFKRELARYLRRRHRFRRPRKVRLSSRPVLTSSASTNVRRRWRIGPCRGIGKGTCSWAMPTRRRSGPWWSGPPDLRSWCR